MNKACVLLLLFLFALAVLAVAPFVGMERIAPSALWSRPEGSMDGDILWKIRLPRVCIGFLGGAALAVCGMVFQAMFRNPLADPFTLGISSGASLGTALSIYAGLAFSVCGVSATSLCAFAGAVLSMLLVYGLTRAKQGFSTATMLLAGVAISFFFSSLILFLQYLSDFTRTYRILRWVMGGLEIAGFDSVLTMLPFVAAGCLVVLYLTHELNLMATGEELAASRGVDVNRTKAALFLTVSLMTGAVVAVCGPIGFVGLMAPHICRLLVGPDHRYLMPASLLFGGAFLTLCDTAARTLRAPTELPVGILTALVGGPFFLWLLLSRSEDAPFG
jgi:iron complex transport system permease protein